MKRLHDLYRLWDDLGDVPANEGEHIEQGFLHFEAGTHREVVWRWFESQNPLFISGEVMQGDRLDAQVVYDHAVNAYARGIASDPALRDLVIDAQKERVGTEQAAHERGQRTESDYLYNSAKYDFDCGRDDCVSPSLYDYCYRQAEISAAKTSAFYRQDEQPRPRESIA